MIKIQLLIPLWGKTPRIWYTLEHFTYLAIKTSLADIYLPVKQRLRCLVLRLLHVECYRLAHSQPCRYFMLYQSPVGNYINSDQNTHEFCVMAVMWAGTTSPWSTSDGHVLQLVLHLRQWHTLRYTGARSQSGWHYRDIRRTWTADTCALPCRSTSCENWRDTDLLPPEVHTDCLQSRSKP